MVFRIVLFLHVLAAFAFLLSHGASVFVSFRLKREEQPERIRALLDLSGATWPLMMLSLLVLLIAGIALGFLTHTWGQIWLWASLILLLAITIWMFRLGQGVYHPLRKLLGQPYMHEGKWQPPEKAAPLAEIKAYLAQTRPAQMAAIGLGGFAFILYLMYFKPF